MTSSDRVRILRATTVEHFHHVPNEVDLLTISPEQSAVFQYLSAINPTDFQYLIADVLVLVERHQLIDVTGGPGDEKQDILTETPEGVRQLTQCKHTVNFADKSSGDDLDVLFGAAFRKSCHSVLYVTNGELTPQAKRYVTDREYSRGSTLDPSQMPTFEYWTALHLWQRIADSNEILNKWFSGAAQVHGLRSVSLSLVSTEMPNRKVLKCDPLQAQSAFTALKISNFGLAIDTWFSTAQNVPGAAGVLPLNAPVPALKVRLTAPTGSGPLDVEAGVTHAASATLLALGETDGWFHQYASPPGAIFFSHDLRRPLACDIGDARMFVRIGSEVGDELEWGFDPGTGFTKGDDDELSWTHDSTGARWVGAVEQQIGLHEAYGIALRQQQIIESVADYEFWRFASTDRVLELLQSVAPNDAVIMQEGQKHLVIAFCVSRSQSHMERLKAFCDRNNISREVLNVGEQQVLISKIEKLPTMHSKFVSERHEIESPIDLHSRQFSLQSEMSISSPSPSLLALLKYKFDYELKWGYDALRGENVMTLGSEELFGRLFEPFISRGTNMIDIGVGKGGKLVLYLRRNVTDASKASVIAFELLAEMRTIQTDLSALPAMKQ
jgi:hypothetical protein